MYPDQSAHILQSLRSVSDLSRAAAWDPMAPAAAMLCPYGFGWKEPSLSPHACLSVDFHVDISVWRHFFLLILIVRLLIVIVIVIVIAAVSVLIQVFFVTLGGCSGV